MKNKGFGVLPMALLLGWGFALPGHAQVTGLTPILVPPANFAIGSQNDPLMEFQVTGSVNAGDLIQYFGIDNNISSSPAAQSTPPDIAAIKLWFQSAPNAFSPGFAVPVTIPATSRRTWGGTTSLAVTVGGYLFVTADLQTAAAAGDNFETTQQTGYVTFGSGLVYPNPGPVTNTSIQTIVTAGTAGSVVLVNVPNASLGLGSLDNLVCQLSVTTTGTAIFQTLQVDNTSSASDPTDISSVKLWFQPGGGTFNASSAAFLTTLNANGSKSWQSPGALNWNVNNGDGFYVTVDISASATRGDACQFQVPNAGMVFNSGSFPGSNLTNSGVQTIPTLTPTPTNSATSSATASQTPTSSLTPTGTPTLTASSTGTPTFTSTPTFSGTPTDTPSVTPSPTPTLNVGATLTYVATLLTVVNTPTSTPTRTPTPPPPTPTPTLPTVIGLTATPTPNYPLYLDGNVFNPQQKQLGMDVRVYQSGEVKLEVFNIAGQRVRSITDQSLQQGNFRFYWDGLNDKGALVGNGVYYVVIQTPGGTKIQKVILLK